MRRLQGIHRSVMSMLLRLPLLHSLKYRKKQTTATEDQTGEVDNLSSVNNPHLGGLGPRNGGMRCVLGVMILMKVVVMGR
jgi:hypothetical protein